MEDVGQNHYNLIKLKMNLQSFSYNLKNAEQLSV